MKSTVLVYMLQHGNVSEPHDMMSKIHANIDILCPSSDISSNCCAFPCIVIWRRLLSPNRTTFPRDMFVRVEQLNPPTPELRNSYAELLPHYLPNTHSSLRFFGQREQAPQKSTIRVPLHTSWTQPDLPSTDYHPSI